LTAKSYSCGDTNLSLEAFSFTEASDNDIETTKAITSGLTPCVLYLSSAVTSLKVVFQRVNLFQLHRTLLKSTRLKKAFEYHRTLTECSAT